MIYICGDSFAYPDVEYGPNWADLLGRQLPVTNLSRVCASNLLIAQQVEKIFPELTRKKVFGKYMTINYIGLIPILVGMIQNQNDRIKNLENKLNGSK